jgi:predicted membrane metal-binding protein
VTANQIVVVNLTTWGWIMMIWGVVLLLAGFGLLSGATWARWFAIVVASLNVIAQLGFVGSAQYPLWALTVLTLTIVVLYALIVHWDDGTQPA